MSANVYLAAIAAATAILVTPMLARAMTKPHGRGSLRPMSWMKSPLRTLVKGPLAADVKAICTCRVHRW